MMPTAQDASAPLAVSMGCPAGVGADVLLKAWQHAALPRFVVLGDQVWLQSRAAQLGIDCKITTVTSPAEAASLPANHIGLLQGPEIAAVTPGTPDPAHAPAILNAIETAVQLCRHGGAAGMVTLPINKASLYASGFTHPGHTEYLASLCGQEAAPVMMLAIEGLRVVPVTIHMPLAQIPQALSADKIIHAATVTHQDLQSKFGVTDPVLAVAGLNPHAGEDGTLGTEERDIISPAIARLQGAGINAIGPLPADTLFHEAARKRFDAVICMYHDQALIPLKTLNFSQGVNITLGLPIVRTSPDHGTAYDIAGSGVADADSFIAAMQMAAALTSRQTGRT